MTIDSPGLFVRDRGEPLSLAAPQRETRDACSTTTSSIAGTESHLPGSYDSRGHETRGSRAMRVSLARAFPVRIAPLREALVNGSITKLARP